MTFEIMTDSTSDLELEYLKAHNIGILGMTVTIGDKTYETVGPDRLNNETLLSEIKAGKAVHTAQINSGQFAELFRGYAQRNEELLYLAFSSGLSGTYQSALMARDIVLEEFPEAKITVFDTLAAASGEGFLVEEAVKLRDAGHSLTEVLSNLTDITPRLQSLFMVDDLHHLARGGRIPKAVAMVGTMANIKPLLDVDPAGKLRQQNKVRGKKKALNALVDNTLAELDEHYPRVIVAYSGTDEVAQTIKAQLLASDKLENVAIRPLSPTIVTHTGAGTVALFSISKQNRK